MSNGEGLFSLTFTGYIVGYGVDGRSDLATEPTTSGSGIAIETDLAKQIRCNESQANIHRQYFDVYHGGSVYLK